MLLGCKLSDKCNIRRRNGEVCRLILILLKSDMYNCTWCTMCWMYSMIWSVIIKEWYKHLLNCDICSSVPLVLRGASYQTNVTMLHQEEEQRRSTFNFIIILRCWRLSKSDMHTCTNVLDAQSVECIAWYLLECDYQRVIQAIRWIVMYARVCLMLWWFESTQVWSAR